MSRTFFRVQHTVSIYSFTLQDTIFFYSFLFHSPFVILPLKFTVSIFRKKKARCQFLGLEEVPHPAVYV